MWAPPSAALCLSLIVGAALALPVDDQGPGGLAAIAENYKPLQTVFKRLINTVVARDSQKVTPKLNHLLDTVMSPVETQELVVEILNGVKTELEESRVELDEEVKAAKAKGDEAASSLLLAEADALDRVIKKTYIAVRMAGTLSPEVLAKMIDKFKPLLVGILESTKQTDKEGGAQGEGGEKVAEAGEADEAKR